MSVPKFQHYVPRFYLARFVDREGFLWVFDKAERRTFKIKPENIAGENRFYDIPELEKSGADRHLMESQLSGIESNVQKITECWLSQVKERERVEIPNTNREIVSLFLTLQLIRTVEYRTVLLQFVRMLKQNGDLSASYDVESDAQGLHCALL